MVSLSQAPLAATYSRVSSKEQVEGYSLNAQCRTARDFASARGYQIVAEYADEGIPVPDTHPVALQSGAGSTPYAGLMLAFEQAADGVTDSEVADALNAAGYGPNPTARRARFTRDAARTTLQNRFYIGELPMGKRAAAGWIKGAHEPIVPVELFEAVQRQRERRATNPNASRVKRSARVYALSGLVRCAECGEPMHVEGVQRLTCWGRRQARGCRAPSVSVAVIEEQGGAYLRALAFPEDTRARILDAYKQTKPETMERDRERQAIQGQLQRLADLYLLGDIEKGDYEARRAPLRAELDRLQTADVHGRPDLLERLQTYLLDAGAAWDQGVMESVAISSPGRCLRRFW
jgi:hypothetical protein